MSNRVSQSQQELLLSFIQKHPILNAGIHVGRAKFVAQKLWGQLAARLNADKEGNYKDTLHWKRYWICLKNKVKTKTIMLSRGRQAGLKKLNYLNEFDRRVLSIIAKEGKLVTSAGANLLIPDVQEEEVPVLEQSEFDASGENDSKTDLTEIAEEVIVEPTDVSMSDNSRCRTSVHQQELLVQLMERFPFLAQCRVRGRWEKQRANRNWDKIAAALNKADPRTIKNGEGWLRYWTCMKSTLRSRYVAARRAAGGGRDAREGFTPLQRRILVLIGDGVDGRQGKRRGCNEDSDIQPTEQIDVNGRSSPLKAEYLDESEEDRETTPLNYQDPMEDPIDTTVKPEKEDKKKKTKQEIQTELVMFQLVKEKERLKQEMARQKEMHQLEMKHRKERHALEIEILQFKKKRLMLEYNRNRKLYITVQDND